jgi:hypothetical protein
MDSPAQTFSSDYLDRRRWVGGVIIAVILGEAIWGLVVSVMNNLVVPWLGDVMGQSSGLPTSFTQRPYNYPDLFISVFEACIAGLVAAILNYFIQRPRAARAPAQLRQIKSSTPPALVPPAPVPASRAIRNPPDAPRPTTPVVPRSTVSKPEPAVSPAPVNVTPPLPPAPPVVAARPVPATPREPANPVAATPPPATPIVQPAKPKKTKEVYYNIVGEPMPYDDD